MSAPGLPCVHCGLCLDTCPTYRLLGTEADSPRGRIYLMEAAEDGRLALDRESSSHLDACLGCLACETACPSGVNFHARIDAFRPRLRLPFARRALRSVARKTSLSPFALKTGLACARIVDNVGMESLRRRVPGLQIFPRRRRGAGEAPIGSGVRVRIPAPARPRARVALLLGCAADVVAPHVTRAAVEVLHWNGAAVVTVPDQTCCGALALHGGDQSSLAACVRANSRAFAAADVDFIVTTAAGCGAVLKEYGALAPASVRDEARIVSGRARDISEVLCALGPRYAGQRLSFAGPVAYHDACHLLHAAKVSSPPRAILAAAVASRVVDLGENHLCCGSAGTYNLEKPRLAGALGARKAQLAVSSGAAVIAVGNVGCMLQIELALARSGSSVPVVHPIELLAQAYVKSRDLDEGRSAPEPTLVSETGPG